MHEGDVKGDSEMRRTKDKRRGKNKQGVQQSIKTGNHRDSRSNENDESRSEKKKKIQVIRGYASKVSED